MGTVEREDASMIPAHPTDPPEVRKRIRRLKDFSPTRAAALENATGLAFLLHVLRDPRAAVVLDALAAIEFQGNFNFWSPLERALALRAHRASDATERDAMRRRLIDAGIHPGRLKGSLLPARREEIERAMAGGRADSILAWHLVYLQELVFLSVARGKASRDLSTETPRVEGVLRELLRARPRA